MPTFAEIAEAVPLIASLIVIEGLLSVDNALAIAALASHLPEGQRKLALKWGIFGAYLFRGVALALAGWIVAHPWLKAVGAAYLVYLMCAHLSSADEGESGGEAKSPPGLWQTILQIELMDLSLSVDNVVAAAIISPKLWVVCSGVFIGILVLRFCAGVCIGLLQRYPVLGKAAFLLVGYVGCLLFVEISTGKHLSSGTKFWGIGLILVASLAYGRFEGLRRVLHPLIWLGAVVMKAIARSVDALFWPLQAFHRLVRRVLARRS